MDLSRSSGMAESLRLSVARIRSSRGGTGEAGETFGTDPPWAARTASAWSSVDTP